ncbi:MAG: MBL fold metallo-hydrolase [Phycisphaerales bacterium]|nr:MBL fold metallo-hydrolase [Phycisphaerales bacterium]
MDSEPDSNAPDARARLERAVRVVRSSARRYPRALLQSVLHLGASNGVAPTGLFDRIRSVDPALAWLGHASMVCNLAGVTVAVDPVLSLRIGARVGKRTLGLARLQPAPASPACIRGVDLVLLTHAHFDHLDRPTLQAMSDRGTSVIAPPGVGTLVPETFGRLHTLDAGKSMSIRGLRITAIQPRHWGARTWIDRHRRVNSYVVEADGIRVLFAGDTAYTESFSRHGPFDLAVFGIGAYNPWVHMHATPEQVVCMADHSQSLRLLPVHHSTFELSDEPVDEPMQRLRRAVSPGPSRLVEPQLGAIINLDGRPLAKG